MPYFVLVLFILAGGLGVAQLLSNRSNLLDAHFPKSQGPSLPKNGIMGKFRAPSAGAD